MKNENRIIADALMLYDHGCWSDRKKAINEVVEKGYFTVGNYEVMPETWCYVIWKKTDFKTNPEFKGEPLSKVVPDTHLTYRQIVEILRNQPWTYH